MYGKRRLALENDDSSHVLREQDDANIGVTENRLPEVTLAGTRIDIVSDAICPWCYIGKRHLERALATLANEGLAFQVHWNPFQLNPDMPKEGRDRAAYRAWKFGSAEKAQALDQRITEAAAAAPCLAATAYRRHRGAPRCPYSS